MEGIWDNILFDSDIHMMREVDFISKSIFFSILHNIDYNPRLLRIGFDSPIPYQYELIRPGKAETK